MRWVFRIAGGTIAVLLGAVLVGGLLLWQRLDSAEGRVALLQWGMPYIESATGYEITADKVESPQLGEWRVGTLKLADEQGEWLSIDALELRFLPEILWKERVLAIERLAAQQVALVRLPASEAEESTQEEDFAMPPVRLNELDIADLVIGEAVAGEAGEQRILLQARLNMQAAAPEEILAVKIHTLQGKSLKVDVSASETEPGRYALRGVVEEEQGGVVGTLLVLGNVPFRSALDAVLTLQDDNAQVLINSLTLQMRKDIVELKGQAELALGEGMEDTSLTALTLAMQGDVSTFVPLLLEESQTMRGPVEATLQAQGELLNPDIQADITLGKVQFSDQSMGVEATASGNVKVAGNLEGMQVNGAIEVQPLYVSLVPLLSSSIPELNVTEYTSVAAASTTQEEEQGAAAEPFPVALDIAVILPGGGTISGRGLRAELKGEIRITGTADEPLYAGGFQTVSGQYKLLGKTFVIREGKLFIDNDELYILASAVQSENGVDVRVDISGNVNRPTITLSSTPPLSQEDIISQLLFGKDAKNITPLQALQLANAVRSLSTGEEGFNPVESAKDILGLDALSLEADEDSDDPAFNVGAGKKLGENVYIGVDKGSDPTKPFKANIEIELTPNLSVESSTSAGASQGGVELLWKKDY